MVGNAHPVFYMSPLPPIDCIAIRHPGQVRRLRTASRDPERIIPKMSDLEAPTTNSGGRKARPYDGQVNPFGRGGVYLSAVAWAKAGPRPPTFANNRRWSLICGGRCPPYILPVPSPLNRLCRNWSLSLDSPPQADSSGMTGSANCDIVAKGRGDFCGAK